jgi:uncharacterized protein (DUF362 family)
MKRRDFFKAGAGLLAGASLSLGDIRRLAGAPFLHPGDTYDLVAVKGGEPDVMFDKAMESLGGLKAFVKPNQKVVVKPNIGWDCAPERAATTHPGLVARIIKRCLEAGAKEVYVFDNTCDQWNKCYQTSGIEKAVKDAGGKIVPGNAEGYYQEVEIGSGRKLKKARVHELILGSDVFINVPILKHHSSADVTICMKNLMGVVWDRGFWHRNDLQQCIADYASYQRKPHLNVVDAYRVMMKHGPKGVSVDDVTLAKTLIVSKDIVAADAAAAKVFGSEPQDIPHIRIAADMGIGTLDLDSLNINRIKLS